MNLRLQLFLNLLLLCPFFGKAGGIVNHPPVGVADVATTPYHTPVTIAVLANDTDEDGDSLRIKYFSAPAARIGSVTQEGQNLVFTPAPGFSGLAQFAYRTYDGMVGAVADTAVSVTVGPRPPPTAIVFTGGQVSSLSAGARWAGFGIPSIYRNGEWVGFLGKVALGDKVFSGIFSGSPQTLRLRVLTGEVARDESGTPMPGVFFTHFADPVFPQGSPSGSANEETRTLFAVYARVGGLGIDERNSTGLWMVPAAGQPFQLLALEGQPAPGTHARFDAFARLAMPLLPGRVFFTAKLRGTGMHPGNDAGLWLWTVADGLRLILRTGSPVDLHNGRSATLAGFQVLGPSVFAPGHGGYSPETGYFLNASLLFTDGSGAAASIGADGAVAGLVLTEKPMGAGNLVAEHFGMPAWSWERGGVASAAAVATLRHGQARVTDANDMAVIDRGGVLARKGARTGIGDSVFSSFADPVKGRGLSQEFTLYRATIGGPGIDVRNNTALFAAEFDGLWTQTQPGKAIARTGNAAPGGGQFSRIISHTVIGGRGPAFTAQLRINGTTVTAATSMGLWATDASGRLNRLMRTGDSVRVGTAMKTLRRFDLLTNVPGSPGQHRLSTPNDPETRIIYRAVFTDLTSAILTMTLP